MVPSPSTVILNLPGAHGLDAVLVVVEGGRAEKTPGARRRGLMTGCCKVPPPRRASWPRAGWASRAEAQ